MKLRVKSPWTIEQERAAYLLVCVILITSIMALRSCAYDSPSMVPAGVNVDNLREAARTHAEGVVR